jgi:hypothetical protein
MQKKKKKKTTTKKTDLRASSQRKVSSAKQPSGLIVTAKKPSRSAGTKSALDNRSHRTKSALDNRSHRTIALIEPLTRADTADVFRLRSEVLAPVSIAF